MQVAILSILFLSLVSFTSTSSWSGGTVYEMPLAEKGNEAF